MNAVKDDLRHELEQVISKYVRPMSSELPPGIVKDRRRTARPANIKIIIENLYLTKPEPT